MNQSKLRLAFAGFHATLGIVILVESVRALLEGLGGHPGALHPTHLAVHALRGAAGAGMNYGKFVH